MNKSEMIGMVMLRLSGGRPTSDLSIREWDVRSYIAPAINAAMNRGDDMNREMEGDSYDYLHQFYGEYSALIDQSGNRAFFTIADKTVPLKGNNGLRLVYDNCGNYYGPLADSDLPSIKYYEKLTPCMKWYRRNGQKVTLYGEDPLTKTVNYLALTDINDLGDDDELPLVAGTEPEAIDMLFALVTGQAQMLYDGKIDKDSLNKAPQR